MVLIDGRPIAVRILNKVRRQVQRLDSPPNVVSLLVGDAGPAVKHAERHAARQARNLGMVWTTRRLPSSASPPEVYAALSALNVDPRVHGILVTRPDESRLSVSKLQQAVHPMKDIEGMHPVTLGNVVYNEHVLVPSTAAAAVELLRAGLQLAAAGGGSKGDNGELVGAEVLIVGQSDVLAKPCCSLLHNEGCTVTVVNPDAPNLPAHTRGADAVITAISCGAGRITGDMLKPGSVLVDVGVNKSYDSVVTGDAELQSCLKVVSAMATLKHGIGLVRAAVLCENLLKCHDIAGSELGKHKTNLT